MTKPVVGVIGNSSVVNDRHNVQLVGQRNLCAIAEVAEALPLMFAGTPQITDIDALLGAVDSILLDRRARQRPSDLLRRRARSEARALRPGSRRHGAVPDRGLRPSAACPLFGICRGFQEMNVAFGGSLHPGDPRAARPHEPSHAAPGERRNPSRPAGRVRRSTRGRLMPDGVFARLFGQPTIRVNSLHGQGNVEPGRRVICEGIAEDGTIEAIRIADAPASRSASNGTPVRPQINPSTAPVQAFGAARGAKAGNVGASDT